MFTVNINHLKVEKTKDTTKIYIFFNTNKKGANFFAPLKMDLIVDYFFTMRLVTVPFSVMMRAK